jgi:hypothetical protein
MLSLNPRAGGSRLCGLSLLSSIMACCLISIAVFAAWSADAIAADRASAGPGERALVDGISSAVDAAPEVTVGCDWVLVYDPSRPDLANFAFPETSARYFVAVGPSSPTAGDALEFTARYPKARFSSLTVYDGYGGFEDAADSARLPNTIYRPKPGLAEGKRKKRTLLVYRTYLPVDGDDGGVGLPVLKLNSGGVKTPLANTPDTAACAALYQNFLKIYGGGKGSLDGGIPNVGVPKPLPKFTVYRGVADGAAGKGQLYNSDNSFMSVDTSSRFGDLMLIRGRAPSYTTENTTGTPNLRYWSICQNGAMSQQVVQCVHDQNVAVDSAGFYTIVISVSGKSPGGAAQSRGFNVLPFGGEQTGEVIYRQQLADPAYAQAIDKVGRFQDAQSVMGDAFPDATYCSVATFEAASNSAEGAFEACKAHPGL